VILKHQATPAQLKSAVPRWFSDDALQAEFAEMMSLDGEAFLAALAGAQAHELRSLAARHRQTPVEVLMKLASDNHQEVNYTARTHPQLPGAERLRWAREATIDYLNGFPLSDEELQRLITNEPEGLRKNTLENMRLTRP
jgi:hypothetical protein